MMPSDDYKTTYRLIGKGRSGWHASGKCKNGSVSSSTYDPREEQLLAYVAEADEGALVYDASRADPGLFYKLVVSGPMCDPYLPDGTVNFFSEKDRETLARMAPGLGGGFKEVAKAALGGPQYGGLDKVSSDLYEAILSRIPGMRVGRVRQGSVEWAAPP